MSIPSFFSKPVAQPRMRVSSFLGCNASCCDFKQLFPGLAGVAPHCGTGDIFTGMQRGKVLENWTVLGGHYLIAIDGTGIRSSHKVKCEKCCVKNHRNGSTSYFHQMLGAAMIHPITAWFCRWPPNPSGKRTARKKTTANAMQQSDYWMIFAGIIRA